MPKNRLTLILISLAIADLLGAIDSTSLNVALPRITSTLHIPITLAQWIPNAFTLTLVALLIFMGKLGDKIGAKKLYLIGLSIFGLSSLILSFVNNISLLIGLRAIQGIGIAILYTMPMVIIAHLWKEREKAFAVTSASFAAGMLIGPIIGGILTNLDINNYYGWHLIFLINIPFVILGLLITAKVVPEIPRNEEVKLDYLSVFILFVALVIITLSFSQINRLFILLGLLLLVGLYFYQKYAKNSLLDFHLFTNQTFSAANIISFGAMISIIGMSFVLTFYLQNILHWNPMQAGFALLPVPIITGIFSAVGGQVKNWKLGAFLSSGLILSGLLVLILINPSIPYYLGVLPGLALVAAGGGFLMTTIFAAILGSAPTEKSGSASGILNTIQQMGALIGIAIVSAITLDYKLSFIVLAVCGTFGVLSAFFVKNNQKLIAQN